MTLPKRVGNRYVTSVLARKRRYAYSTPRDNNDILALRHEARRIMPGLRVLAGPTAEDLVPVTDIINTGRAYSIRSERFEGKVAIYVKNFVDPKGRQLTSEYFEREDRKGITWSIQVQGRFLQPHSTDDILFGNVFEKRLKLPWGSGAALKFMHFVDPTLEYNLTSNKPWALSPLIATMPHFSHERIYKLDGTPQSDVLPFPSLTSLSDETSQLCTASTSSVRQSRSCDATPPSSRTSLSTSWSSSSDTSSQISTMSYLRDNLKRSFGKAHMRRKGTHDMDFRTATERRSFFANAQHRRDVVLGPQDLVTTDFCYGYLEFSPNLALRLPGGISFDLIRYWDKHPVRFICCERKNASDEEGDLVGNIFWCVSFEEGGDDDEPELSKPVEVCGV